MENAKTAYNVDNSFGMGIECNLLYLFSNNIYVITMIAFNIAKPWREGFYTNLPLMISIILVTFYNQVIILWADGTWVELFDSVWLPDYTSRWVILGTSWGFGIAIWILQKCLFEPLSNWLVKKYPQHKWL